MSTVTRLAGRLQTYPAEKVLTAYELYERYDPDAIREVLDSFTPENTIIMLTSQTLEDVCQETDHWYGTKYNKLELPADLCAKLTAATHDALDLPPKNPYIPKDFSLLPPGSEKYP